MRIEVRFAQRVGSLLDRQAGTFRFGPYGVDHPSTCIYVVDTSFFESIGAVNPALPAMANAMRVDDHLLERIGAKTSVEAVA